MGPDMWACEQRSWGLSDWEVQLGARVSKGSLPSRFDAVQDILSHDPKNRTMLDQINRCGEGQPCQHKYCHKCYGRPLDPNTWRVDRHNTIADDVLNPVYYNDWVGCGPYRHIQRIQKFLQPFYGLPTVEIAPFTTKFCYLQGGEDHLAAKDWYRDWMRVIGQEFRSIVHPDVKFSYRFEWSFTTAKDAVWDLPMRAPGVADVKTMDPDQVVALLHCHGLAHFPGFTHRQAGQFFRMVFDGPSQVHISTPQVDQVAKAYGNWPSMIELEEAVSAKSITTQLPDHPEEAAWPHDIGSTHPDCHASKDGIWDAMAYEMFGDDEDGRSGLVGFVNYLHKEHLPKAESRYQKLAEAKQAQSSLSPSTNATTTPCLSKILSPEQMVVAVHADAELKRAFHNKRLTCSFGTQRKAQSSNSEAVTNTSKKDTSSQKSVPAHRQAETASKRTKPVVPGLSPIPETAVHWCVGPSTTDHNNPHLPLAPSIEPKEAPSYKEACHPWMRRSLFSWVFVVWRFTLCLAQRLLRPP